MKMVGSVSNDGLRLSVPSNSTNIRPHRGRNLDQAICNQLPQGLDAALRNRVLSIIGDDNRIFDLSTVRLPQRLVCALNCWRGDDVTHGTAWLAGSSIAVTAAHCLYDPDLGWVEKVEVVPGLADTDAPFGRLGARRLWIADRWLENQDWRWDIGCVELEQPAGKSLGWFGVEIIGPQQSFDGIKVRVAGYPETDGQFSIQRSATDAVAGIINGRLYHIADTENGQSGGPMWRNDDDQSPPSVFGVHGREAEEVEIDGAKVIANSGVPCLPEVAALITSWSRLGQ